MFDPQWELALKTKIQQAKNIAELPWQKAAQAVYHDRTVIALVHRLAKC